MNVIKEVIYHLANIDTAIRDGYLRHLFQRIFCTARWKEFFWVVRYWRLYYNTISAMHNEWFSIDVNAPVQYMCNGDSLYCKYCGCKYVSSTPLIEHDRYSMPDWISNGVSHEDRQRHLPGCLHYDIVKLRSCWR